MNTRIKELAKQVAAYEGDFTLVMYDDEIVRFAVLIIEECARVQTERSCGRHGYDKHVDGLAILQHFGVEE